MLLHLETGTYASGAGQYEITEAGLTYCEAISYRSDTSDYDFQCPTCETTFSL
jgi:Zn finger protein HypA/HybF involved in hydrogenase expression